MVPHPPRIKNRLPDYDYSQDGFYFVTICTKNHIKCFGKITNGEMRLNEFGEIAKQRWLWMAQHFDFVQLDEFCIMPNHLHGIIIINRDNSVATTLEVSLQRQPQTDKQRRNNLLSKTIAAFKTTASKYIHKAGFDKFKWQRSFYDHVIRNEKSLLEIREYIRNNPLKWDLDKYHSG
ncbi:MAG: transposase [Candidatus Zixiibacteriota bacterium]